MQNAVFVLASEYCVSHADVYPLMPFSRFVSMFAPVLTEHRREFICCLLPIHLMCIIEDFGRPCKGGIATDAFKRCQ